MPLQPIALTESTAANQLAQQTVAQVAQLGLRIAHLRANGTPARPAQPERTGPNGQISPATPAVPAVTPAALAAALGVDNCALFDEMASALGITPATP